MRLSGIVLHLSSFFPSAMSLQVVRLGSKCLYTMSHLAVLLMGLLLLCLLSPMTWNYLLEPLKCSQVYTIAFSHD